MTFSSTLTTGTTCSSSCWDQPHSDRCRRTGSPGLEGSIILKCKTFCFEVKTASRKGRQTSKRNTRSLQITLETRVNKGNSNCFLLRSISDLFPFHPKLNGPSFDPCCTPMSRSWTGRRVPANLGRLVAPVSNLQQRCLICPLRCQVIACPRGSAPGGRWTTRGAAFSATVTGERVSRGRSHASVRGSSLLPAPESERRRSEP